MLIWGPPGTGKTTTMAEIVFQYEILGYNVLVTTPR